MREVPFAQKLSCTIAEAVSATGIGRSKLYEMIADKRIESTMVDGKRLVLVRSLIGLVGAHAAPAVASGSPTEPRAA
jgi:excisionase family DNA binding protein